MKQYNKLLKIITMTVSIGLLYILIAYLPNIKYHFLKNTNNSRISNNNEKINKFINDLKIQFKNLKENLKNTNNDIYLSINNLENETDTLIDNFKKSTNNKNIIKNLANLKNENDFITNEMKNEITIKNITENIRKILNNLEDILKLKKHVNDYLFFKKKEIILLNHLEKNINYLKNYIEKNANVLKNNPNSSNKIIEKLIILKNEVNELISNFKTIFDNDNRGNMIKLILNNNLIINEIRNLKENNSIDSEIYLIETKIKDIEEILENLISLYNLNESLKHYKKVDKSKNYIIYSCVY